MSELNEIELDDYDTIDSEVTNTSTENPLHSIKVNVIKIDPDIDDNLNPDIQDLGNKDSDIKEINLDDTGISLPCHTDKKFKVVTVDENKNFFNDISNNELNLDKLIESNKVIKDLEKEDPAIEELDLDSLIRLNDESTNSGVQLCDNKDEEINLTINNDVDENINLDELISIGKYREDEEEHIESNVEEDYEEPQLNLYIFESKGGAKNKSLPLDFDKIEGTYVKTKEYLQNKESEDYRNYKEKLKMYYVEQKSKKNKEKFNYYVNESGYLVKECKDNKKCKDNFYIKPPVYDNIKDIIKYLSTDLEDQITILKKARDKVIVENTDNNLLDFEEKKKSYQSLFHQINIFKSYNNIINNIKNNKSIIAENSKKNYKLRFESRELLKEITKLTGIERKEKIKQYLELNTQINNNSKKSKELKNLEHDNDVIFKLPEIVKGKISKKQPKSVENDPIEEESGESDSKQPKSVENDPIEEESSDDESVENDPIEEDPVKKLQGIFAGPLKKEPEQETEADKFLGAEALDIDEDIEGLQPDFLKETPPEGSKPVITEKEQDKEDIRLLNEGKLELGKEDKGPEKDKLSEEYLENLNKELNKKARKGVKAEVGDNLKVEVKKNTPKKKRKIIKKKSDLESIKVTVSKIQTTNKDKDGKVRKMKDIKTGPCKFPFKNGRKLVKEEDGCVEGKTGKWCATEVDEKTKKKLTWAYCKDEDNN